MECQWSMNDLALYRSEFGDEAVAAKRFYNIGAGRWSHPAWTNVDNPSDWYEEHQESGKNIAIPWDAFAQQPVKIDDSSAELAYCSHVVEHLDNAADRFLLSDVYRSLKPGGVFRIACPDAERAYHAWLRNDRNYFNWIDRYSKPNEMERIGIRKPMRDVSLGQVFLYMIASCTSELHADGVNPRITDAQLEQLQKELSFPELMDNLTQRCTREIQQKYPGNHMNWFSAEKLMGMLRDAGFSDVYSSGYGQSRSAVMRNIYYFDYRRPHFTLYVEAIK